MRLTRKAREQHRHDRAVVVQQLCTPSQADVDAERKANLRRAAALKLVAKRQNRY